MSRHCRSADSPDPRQLRAVVLGRQQPKGYPRTPRHERMLAATRMWFTGRGFVAFVEMGDEGAVCSALQGPRTTLRSPTHEPAGLVGLHSHTLVAGPSGRCRQHLDRADGGN